MPFGPLAVLMATHDFKGFKVPPNRPQKGPWLGVFHPNWQNHKIAVTPTAKIGSTSHFDRVIEPHSQLRRWSGTTKLQFKMADGSHWKMLEIL